MPGIPYTSSRRLHSFLFNFAAFLLISFFPAASIAQSSSNNEPLRIGIVGFVHGHVHGFIRDAMAREDIEVVGVVEPDAALLKKYGDRYEVPEAIRFRSLEEMLDSASPEAVTVFTNTFDHKEVVEVSAARGVHVMMEKPLAVSMDHARAIQKAALATSLLSQLPM